MGGPGSGGFRGYGWPPGSADGPSQSSQLSQSSTTVRARKGLRVRKAINQKRYRTTRSKNATVREKALQEARRMSTLREYNVRAIKPLKHWTKFKQPSKKKFVVFLHDVLPLWLRGKIKEFTSCRGNLVLLDVDEEPMLKVGETKQCCGPRRKVKSSMAVPLKDLWIAKEW